MGSADGGLRPIGGTELSEHVDDVRLDGVQGEPQLDGDLGVTPPGRHQAQDLELAGGEVGLGRRGLIAAAGELIEGAHGQRRLDRPLAAQHAPLTVP